MFLGCERGTEPAETHFLGVMPPADYGNEPVSHGSFEIPSDNTERPVTMSEGTNLLVGTDPAKIVAAAGTCRLAGGKLAEFLAYGTATRPGRLSRPCCDWYPGKKHPN